MIKIKMNYTDAAYAAIMRTLHTGSTYVARDGFCGLTTVLAIGKREQRGIVRRKVTARRSGVLVHSVCGVELTKRGLRDMRADIIARNGEIPAALTAALAPPAPAYVYRSIIRDIDPFLVVGGREDDIPF